MNAQSAQKIEIMSNITLPTSVLSHWLAHGVEITPDAIRDAIIADQNRGYSGMAFVPALMDIQQDSNAVLKVFKELGAEGLVVGFNAGGDENPSPFKNDEWKQCLANLRPVAKLIADGADMEVMPPLMVGPWHTYHRSKLIGWNTDTFKRWMEACNNLFEEFGIDGAAEPLNEIEDETPSPFARIEQAAAMFENIFLHYDTGHAHAHNLGPADMKELVSIIRYFEFANVGRSPLNVNRGIDFPGYIKFLHLLSELCAIGDEPFCKAVIKAFNLLTLCDTMVEGTDALDENSAFLRKHKVIPDLQASA